MTLSAPTQMIFIISIVLGIVGLLGSLGVIGAVAGYSFWLMTAAWALLVAGSVLKGI